MKANIGCGYDLKPGWVNIDFRDRSQVGVEFHLYDITTNKFGLDFAENFDFALVNHVLCTMRDALAHESLLHIYQTLKPGGKIQAIDMDILKVFKSYQEGRVDDIPILEGSIDDRLCLALSGYGARDSLYTPVRLSKVLVEAGFHSPLVLPDSEYDTRPFESLVVEATK